MKGELFTLGGFIDGVRSTKDTFKVILAFPINYLDTQQIGRLTQIPSTNNTEVFVMMKTADFVPEEAEIMKEMEVEKDDSQRSPSERMWRTLYALYKVREDKGTQQFATFKQFYDFAMEKQLEQIRKQIEKEQI